MTKAAPMSRTGLGKGAVLEPQHDARLANGRRTAGRIATAWLASARAGDFRPPLKVLAAAAEIPASTVKLHFSRVAGVGAAVAKINPAEIVNAVGLRDLRIDSLSPADLSALAHALATGERAPWLK